MVRLTRRLAPGVLILAWTAPTHAAEPAREQVEFFEKKIRPVLVQHCYKCHSAEAAKAKGGLFLDNRSAMHKGGDTPPPSCPATRTRASS